MNNRLLIYLILFLWASSFGIGLAKAASAEAPLIRVRMLAGQKKLSVEGLSLSIQASQRFIPVSLPRSSNRKIWVSGNQFVVDDGQQIKFYSEPFLRIQGEGIRVNGRLQPQDIFLTRDEKKSVMDVIGVLELEKYLIGVLAGEMPLSWPLETLKAQAVVARGYALAVMRERARSVYHVESTVLDQVYRAGPSTGSKFDRVLQAVRETQGLVLENQRGKILKSFFHADCGGRTQDAKTVWGGDQTTEVVVDSFCDLGGHSAITGRRESSRSSGRAPWRAYYSFSDLERRLGAQAGEKILSLAFDTESGKNRDSLTSRLLQRVLGVTVRFSRSASNPGAPIEKEEESPELASRQVILTGNQFREKLGYQVLRSTLMKVIRTENGYAFEGQGFGHGVGMCQLGAKFLGDSGQNFREILSHYFPRSTLGRRILEVKTAPELSRQI